MWQDIRYALRTLFKKPGFTAVAVVAIALGVGPNSAIFSIVNAVLLRPLPYPESDRLVMLWQTMKERGLDQVPVSGPNLADWQRDSRSFEGMAAAFMIPEYGFNVTLGGEPERALAARAAHNFFRILRVNPVAGRSFLAEEDRQGANPVVMISHSFWQRRFGGNPGAIGRAIGLDGVSHTVVGVLPIELESLAKVDLWIPIASDLALEQRDHHNYGVVARLKPGVTLTQAQTEMNAISQRLERDYPEANAGCGASVLPLSEVTTGPLRPALLVLLAAVGVLLLIACANVASLQLARAGARQKEIALRIAVGASRWRVIRQLLIESVVLAAMGGTLGLLLAWWSVRGLRGLIPDIIPRLKEMAIDVNVLAFTLGVSILTGLLFGLVPALRASKASLSETLKEGGGGKGSIGGGHQRTRTVLLVGEVALATVLLVCAGLLVRSFVRVTAVDPGFRPDNLLTMHLALPGARYETPLQRGAFCKAVLQRVRTLPGVRSASVVNYLPMRGGVLNMRISLMLFQVEGQPPARPGQEPSADYRVITPGYLDTMGISLHKGRDFSERDQATSTRVVLINETMARQYFPGEDPVGKRLRLPPFDAPPALILGVVSDVRLYGLEGKVEPTIYAPYEQDPQTRLSIVVRSASDPTSLSGPVRREILAVDSDQPVSAIRTMQEAMSEALLVRRLSVWLLGTFAALALVLAAVGIYGLIAFAVSQRTHEIGLRMALGAEPGGVLRSIVVRGLAVGLAGVACGLPAAFGLARLMRGLLFGIGAADPVIFVAIPTILATVSALASYVPARKAMRVDPMIALRYE